MREWLHLSCTLTVSPLACAGHPEFHIHSGESAVIFPRAVAIAGRKPIAAVATGKHHTAAITRAGELYTWGSNRDGRLGYPAVDTQPIPRRWGPVCDAPTPACKAVAIFSNRHDAALPDLAASFSSCQPQLPAAQCCACRKACKTWLHSLLLLMRPLWPSIFMHMTSHCQMGADNAIAEHIIAPA